MTLLEKRTALLYQCIRGFVCLFVGQEKHKTVQIHNLSLCFYLVFVCRLSCLEWRSMQSERGTTKAAHLIFQKLPTNPERARPFVREWKEYCSYCEDELWIFFSALVCRKVCSLHSLRDYNSKTAAGFEAHCKSVLQTVIYLNINAVIFIILIFLRESRGKVIDYSLRSFHL